MCIFVNSVNSVPAEKKIPFSFLLELPKHISSRPDSVWFIATLKCFCRATCPRAIYDLCVLTVRTEAVHSCKLNYPCFYQWIKTVYPFYQIIHWNKVSENPECTMFFLALFLHCFPGFFWWCEGVICAYGSDKAGSGCREGSANSSVAGSMSVAGSSMAIFLPIDLIILWRKP